MGLSRILSLLFFIAISEVIAGFVQENQNIFYEQYQPAPISYQSFVNFDKFPSSDRNSFDVHHSLKAKPISHQSKSLFKAADFAEKAAYHEEVENAHRAALANRHNNSDAAYIEAYTEALQAQRRADGSSSAGAKGSYFPSYLHQFDFSPEYSNSHLLSDAAAESKSDVNIYQNRYEDVGNKDYNVNYNDGDNYEFRKSVEYVVPSGYEFNANGVVHQQPEIIADKKSEIQFAQSPAVETFGSSVRHQ